jgi:hypothetical protein
MLSKIELRELIEQEISQTLRLKQELVDELSNTFSPTMVCNRFEQCGEFEEDWLMLDAEDEFEYESTEWAVY